jgi:phosphatidylglycerol:prolipoprotein diacylglycerol transferase
VIFVSSLFVKVKEESESSMLPNLTIPALEIWGPIKLEPFGVLVASAVLLGYELAHRRARNVGLNTRFMADGMLWAVVIGFIVSHWVDEIFYYPERIAENPWSLLMFWTSISSFGGFFGGIIGAWIYFKKMKKVPLLPYLEAILFGFAPAWILGRLGCTIAFDHPGLATDFFLGMKDVHGVVRHNLGFYEFLATILITVVLYRMKNIKPFVGFHLALVTLMYVPVRFFWDTLRTADKTYWGMTPGQYFSILLGIWGVFLIIRGLGLRKHTPKFPHFPRASLKDATQPDHPGPGNLGPYKN